MTRRPERIGTEGAVLNPFAIIVERCFPMPPDWFALRRKGRVVDHGRIKADLAAKYQAGDIVLISPEVYDRLMAAGTEGA